jgi:hypothetical protein
MTLTLNRLRQLLEYSPDDGVFVWLVNRRGRFARVGEVAGKLNEHGYIRIGIDGRIYLAHRLAWFFVHGEWPHRGLDHANGNAADNRISNLRLATTAQNIQNSRARVPHGLKGAYYKPRYKKKPWIAQIKYDKKSHHLGSFATAKEANAAYLAAATEAFGAFARAA